MTHIEGWMVGMCWLGDNDGGRKVHSDNLKAEWRAVRMTPALVCESVNGAAYSCDSLV